MSQYKRRKVFKCSRQYELFTAFFMSNFKKDVKTDGHASIYR